MLHIFLSLFLAVVPLAADATQTPKNVYEYHEGLEDWKAKGYPTVQSVNPEATKVLYYWFGEISTPEDYPEKTDLWFGGQSEVDRAIRDQFEQLVIAASKGELSSWEKTPRERLALVILLDQFSRNIYRDSPKAFAFDSLAQKLVLEGLEKKDDLNLLPIERVFFYLPLEHAENRHLQKLSVSKFQQIVADAPATLKSKYESYLDYALQHQAVIDKFDRFPHRNPILGRISTQEETQYLQTRTI